MEKSDTWWRGIEISFNSRGSLNWFMTYLALDSRDLDDCSPSDLWLMYFNPSYPSSLDPPVNSSPFLVIIAEWVTPRDIKYGSKSSLYICSFSIRVRDGTNLFSFSSIMRRQSELAPHINKREGWLSVMHPEWEWPALIVEILIWFFLKNSISFGIWWSWVSPWPSYPSSPYPQEKTLPYDESAIVCCQPHATYEIWILMRFSIGVGMV